MNNIRYGDLVTLTAEFNKDNDKLYGFISSKGFNSRKVFIECIKGNNIKNLNSIFNCPSKYGLFNYRDFIFEIMPKLNFESKINYYNFLMEFKENKNRIEKLKDEITVLEYKKLLIENNNEKLKLNNLKVNYEKEEKNNKLKINSFKGKILKFDVLFLLKHRDSEYYLEYTNKNTKTDEIAQYSKLVKYFNKNSFMKLVPKFKSKKKNDPVTYNDYFYLKYKYDEIFLDFTLINEDITRKINIGEEIFDQELILNNQTDYRFRVIFSNKNNISWKFLKLVNYNETNTDNLIIGDLIRIEHTENNYFLDVDYKYKFQNPEIYLKYYFNNSKINHSISSIWEINNRYLNSDTATFNSKTDSIYFRNIKFGKLINLLTYKNGIKIPVLNNDCLNEDHFEDFRFEPVVKNKNIISNNNIYYIKSTFGYWKLEKEILLEINRIIKKNKNVLKNNNFIPLNDSDINEKKYLIFIEKLFSTLNAYNIIKITPEEKKEVLYLKSFLLKLYLFKETLINKKYSNIKFYRKIKKALINLLRFIYNDDNSEILGDLFSYSGTENTRRQTLIKDFGIIDILIEIINKPFKNKIYKLEELFQNSNILILLKDIYKILIHIFKNNFKNHLYCSQWINLFLNQSTMTKYFNDINSETIQNLLENNKTILETKINSSIIYKYIQLLEEEKKLRFLNIMRVITICNKRPMYQNQKSISIIILKNSKKLEKFIFKFENSENHFYLILNGKTIRKIDLCIDFENISYYSLEEQEFRYFIIGMINFFADIVFKRNYIAIRVFKEYYPFKLFFLNIWKNDLIPLVIKGPILKFLRRLWLDIHPNKKSITNNQLKFLNDNLSNQEEKLEKNETKVYKENLNELKLYLKNYLKSKSYSIKEDNLIEMSYLNEVLETILFFFKFQLFDEKDLKSIYKKLKKIIKIKIDILNSSKKSQNIKKNIEEFFEIIVNIFKYMIDFEFEKKTNFLFNKIFTYLEDEIKNNFNEYLKYSDGVKNEKITNKIFAKINENLSNYNNNVILDDKKFNKILFRMTLIDSIYIISKSIYLLNIIHSKYDQIKKQFLNFQIIDKFDHAIYISLRDTSNYIFKISETLDLWFIKQDEKTIKKLDYFLKDILLILNDNQFNPIYLKSDNDPYRKIYVNEIYFENIYKIINKISKKNQEKIIKTDVIKNFLKIIKFTNLNYEIIGGNHLIEKLNIILLIISRTIYNINLKDDLILDIFDITFVYFEKEKIAINSYLLMNNLIKLYPKILNEKLTKLINCIIKKCKNLNTNNIEKAYSLNLLSILIKNCDDNNIIEIQNYILKIIIDINNKELFYFIKNKDVKIFNIYLNNKDNIMEITQGKFWFLPQKLSYAISFIKLLRCFTISKNNFTENICQNYLKINDITEILRIDNLHILYKLIFIKFFKNTYLETERNNLFHINEIILVLLTTLVKEFKILFKYFIKNNMLFDQNKYDKLYYVSNNFCLENNDIKKKLLKLLIDCFYLIIEKHIILNKDSIYYKNYNYMVREILKVNLDKTRTKKIKLSDTFYQEKVDKLLYKIIENSPENMEEILKYKIIKQSNLFTSKKVYEEDENIEFDQNKLKNKNLIKKIYIQFFDSSIYIEQKRQEIDEFMHEIVNLINNNEDLNFDNFFNNLIKYLKHELNSNNLKKQKFKVVLIIFRKYIELSVPDNHTNLVNWEYFEWDHNIEEIKKRQNKLVEIDTVDMILDIIINSQDIDIIEEAINLSIALLLGGNKNSQNKFYDRILNKNNNNFLNNIFIKNNNILNNINRDFEKESLDKIKKFIFENNESNFKIESLNDKMNFIKSNFRFFQLLCEGHNINWQNFWRTQKKLNNFSINIDFISFSSNFFGSLIKYIRPEILNFSNQILDFMIESNQGPCKKNQKTYFNHKVIDYCKDLMNEFNNNFDYKMKGFIPNDDFDDNNNIFQMDLFFWKVIKFINSMLEGNTDKNIIKYISKSIEIEYLLKKLCDIFNIYLKIKFPKIKLSENIIEDFQNYNKWKFHTDYILDIFEIYYLLQYIFDYNPNLKHIINNSEDSIKWSYEFFRTNTGNIEIIFNNQFLTQYFIIQPCCFNLDDKVKELFIRSLNRNNSKDKLNDIINRSSELFDKIEHRFHLSQGNKMNIFTPPKYIFLRRINFIISIIINLFIFITYEKTYKDCFLVNNISDRNKTVLQILATLQLLFWIIVTIFWYHVELPIILIEKWRKLFKQIFNIDDTINYSSKEKIISVIRENIKFNTEYQYLSPKFFYYYKSLFFILNNKLFYYFITFWMLSIFLLVHSIDNCFVYSIFLLDIVFHYETIRNIILSITNDKDQLLLSSLLAIILLFFFSEFAFLFLNDDFFNSSIENGENLCKNLYQCFISILYWGPRLSGSIGDQLVRPTFTSMKRYAIRYVFDFIIFILINVIFLNLIFGIIIDTFAKLRDKKKFIDYEILNKCNICSLERFIFDKNNKNFDYHVEKEHNIWNYLFYIYYLKNKEITEYTGIESYIKEKLKYGDVFWMPIERAKGIEINKKNYWIDKKISLIDNFVKKLKKLNKKN